MIKQADGAEFTRRAPLVQAAYEFAVDAHADQTQDSDGAPYIEHPVAVARLLYESGSDDVVVAAALLHGTVEDTDARIEDIGQRFGGRVAELVAALTEPAEVELFEARKAALRRQVVAAGRDAEAIFAADKVDNAANLRNAITRLGVAQVRGRLSKPLDEKVAHYEATLRLLEHVSESPPLLDQLRRELGGLDEIADRRRAFALAERAAAAISRLDAGGLVEVCDAEVEWWPALTLGARGGPYRGHRGIQQYIVDLRRSWKGLRTDVHEYRAVDDRLMVICDIRARGRVSGRSIAQQSAVVYWLRSERILCARTYLDASDAGAAVIMDRR